MKQTSNKLFLHAQRGHYCATRLRIGRQDWALLHDSARRELPEFPENLPEGEMELIVYAPGTINFEQTNTVRVTPAADSSLRKEWRAAYKQFRFLQPPDSATWIRVSAAIMRARREAYEGIILDGNVLMPPWNKGVAWYFGDSGKGRITTSATVSPTAASDTRPTEARLLLSKFDRTMYDNLARHCRGLVVSNCPVIVPGNATNIDPHWVDCYAVTAAMPNSEFASAAFEIIDTLADGVHEKWRTDWEETQRPDSTAARRRTYVEGVSAELSAEVPIATSTIQATAARVALAASSTPTQNSYIFAEGYAGQRRLFLEAVPRNGERVRDIRWAVARAIATGCSHVRFAICAIPPAQDIDIITDMLDRIDAIKKEAGTLGISFKDTLLVRPNGEYSKL